MLDWSDRDFNELVSSDNQKRPLKAFSIEDIEKEQKNGWFLRRLFVEGDYHGNCKRTEQFLEALLAKGD